MGRQTLAVLTIVLFCITGVWASTDYVYVANAAGGFYRIRITDYSTSGGPFGFGNIKGLAVLPNGQVAIGNTDGGIWVANGDPTNWVNSAASGGWGPISTLVGLPTGNIAYGATDGAIRMVPGNLNPSGFSYGLGYGSISAMTTLANGSFAFASSTIGAVYVSPGTIPFSGTTAGVGGWGTVSAIAGLPNGNVAFGNTTGSVFVTTNQIEQLNALGGCGNVSAMTVLANGKIAFGNTAGTIYVTNSDLSSPVNSSGFGAISAMTALPNGNFVVANSAGGVYFINSTNLSIMRTLTGFGDVSAMAAMAAVVVASAQCGELYPFPVGDLNGDCVVNFKDISLFAAHWFEFNGQPPLGNLNSDTTVNFADMAILAAHWQENSMTQGSPPPPVAGASQFTLNGLQITLDGQSGSITKLSYPGTGDILQASSASASLVTTSCTELAFIAAQFSSQFSPATILKQADGSYTIVWESLSPNRSGLSVTGSIRAQVTIKAAPDTRSVILSCHIDNNSNVQLAQVLFPDFAGLRPFDTPNNMELRMAMGVISPFAGPVHDADSAPFYPIVLWNQYPPAGMYHMDTLRWMDFGSLKGGLSVFQKKWLTEPRPTILTHRDEADPNFLRAVWQHSTPIPSGQSWDSGEFWLTPHRGGWAKGIEVFRNYVNTVNPPREVPVKIKEGLGCQTIWMMQSADQIAFHYTDLPAIAQDAKNCGIDNIVAWGWCQYGTLYPSIQLQPQLGTLGELTNGVAQAKSIGVDIAPFINLTSLGNDLAERYGITPGSGVSWTYNPDLIPAMVPLSSSSGGIYVPPNNIIWQGDVNSVLLQLAASGISNFCWDVFQDTGDMSLVRFIKGVRTKIKTIDPQASFGGEPTDATVSSLERASQTLDYTWDWQDFLEAGPILNVLKYPRINCNVENSPRVVKMAFADGLYINAMPKQPNQANGTKLLSQEPALYSALQQTSLLRKQFLPYFTDGIFIGESVLATPVCEFVRTKTSSQNGGATFIAEEFEYPLIFVRGHQLSNKLLIIVLNNDSVPRQVTLESKFDMWLPAVQNYSVKRYNNAGALVSTNLWASGVSNWTGTTNQLAPLELAFFEIEVSQ